MNSHPTPGSLFAMGWLRSLWKDFIRFFKSAKRKNYLLMASILIYFLYHPNRSSPKTITLHPPPALPAGHASFRIHPLLRPRFLGWLLCVLASFCVRLRPQCIFFTYFLSINSTAEPTPLHSPARSTPVASLLHRPPNRFRRL